jgi:hypothetical protein
MQSKSVALELLNPGDEDNAKEGDVRALFSTLNEIDKDNDVTLPGAFVTGAPVRIAAYGHNSTGMSPQLPTGRGEIFADDEKAVMRGRFFLETTLGKDTYVTVKEMGDLQEWSYEYDILDAEPGTFRGQPVQFLKSLKVHGVTPVYIGAGIGTATLDIKSFTDHGEQLAELISDYVQRAKNRAQFRGKEGRTLSTANRNRLAALVESLATVGADIAKLLEDTDPEKNAATFEKLRNEFLRTDSQLAGMIRQ